mmetsp:Transcript_23832/g.60755  ORF Transcript_23832/g.60755 Transcript_23832/m.60755 type:complete len:359 (-) Transcript_23832:274-1350(-)
MVSTRSAKTKALVTGGSGFVGHHLVQQLVDSGKYDVVVFDVRDNGKSPAPVITGDLRKLDSVVEATKGVDVVFHVATAAPTGQNALNNQLMHSVNVDGTANVIKACAINGVTKLVYTSSSSVVFEGKDLINVDESHPYAKKPMDYYVHTKILGERLVLEANGQGGLATVALRPSGIFGEGDLVFVPTVVKQARAGKMKYIIGSGKNKCDWTYVGNVAQSHILAAEALDDPARAPRVAGKAYFVTNQDPRAFWGMMGDVCEGLGYARPRIHLPLLLILAIAILFEWVIRPLLRPFKELNSDFTVNRILLATRQRTFSCDAAARDLGYKPRVGMAEALQRTLAHFEGLRNDSGGARSKAQ